MKVFIILMIAALASPASAQSSHDLTRLTDSWGKQNKVFVTASARKQLSEKLMVIGAYPIGKHTRRRRRITRQLVSFENFLLSVSLSDQCRR